MHTDALATIPGQGETTQEEAPPGWGVAIIVMGEESLEVPAVCPVLTITALTLDTDTEEDPAVLDWADGPALVTAGDAESGTSEVIAAKFNDIPSSYCISRICLRIQYCDLEL